MHFAGATSVKEAAMRNHGVGSIAQKLQIFHFG
jgi:hypothetical protein